GEQLRLKVEQATDFFRHSALLVDLHQLNRDDLPLDLKPLLKLLRDREFLPIGVRGASDEQAVQARALGLSVHTFGAAMTQVERVAAQKAARKALREGTRPAPEPEPREAEPQPVAEARAESAPENRIVSDP